MVRHAANLHGVLSCYDRIFITGTLPGAGQTAGITGFLYANCPRQRAKRHYSATRTTTFGHRRYAMGSADGNQVP